MRMWLAAAHLETDNFKEGDGAGEAGNAALKCRIGQLDTPVLLLPRICGHVADVPARFVAINSSAHAAAAQSPSISQTSSSVISACGLVHLLPSAHERPRSRAEGRQEDIACEKPLRT